MLYDTLHLALPLAGLVAACGAISFGILYSLSLDGFAYARPFGVAEEESLMNLAELGSLNCLCQPTDAAERHNDRRRSCRNCGNALVTTDPGHLYRNLGRAEIRRITRTLHRAGIDARRGNLPVGVTSLSELHGASMATRPSN